MDRLGIPDIVAVDEDGMVGTTEVIESRPHLGTNLRGRSISIKSLKHQTWKSSCRIINVLYSISFDVL